jgi:hypothetical protein
MIGIFGLLLGLIAGIPIGMCIARDMDAGVFDRPHASDPPATARALRRRQRAMRADLRRALRKS